MFVNNVHTFQNLPIEDKNRKCTDVCCTICTAIFALTMFILSFVVYRPGTFKLTQITITRQTTRSMTAAKHVCSTGQTNN